MPTATAVPTPGPTAAPTAAPPPLPTATAVPEAASTLEAGINLSEDCLPGGVLDNAATILSCGMQAIQQVESFSFDGSVDLLALFPFDGAVPGEGAIRMNGAVVTPDKLQFTVSMEADGEKIEINGLTIGRDAYVQNPESGQWFKGGSSRRGLSGPHTDGGPTSDTERPQRGPEGRPWNSKMAPKATRLSRIRRAQEAGCPVLDFRAEV